MAVSHLVRRCLRVVDVGSVSGAGVCPLQTGVSEGVGVGGCQPLQ
jgi:hypothetical protein